MGQNDRHELKPRLRGLLMDLNFNHKGVIREIRGRFGADAVLFVQEILFSLAAEPGGKMRRSGMVTIGHENGLKMDQISEILELLLTYSSPWLFKGEADYLYSDRILDEQTRYLNRCKVNKRNRNTKRRRIVERSEDDCIDLDLNTNTDLNNNKKSLPSGPLSEWIAYRRSIGKKLSPGTIQKLIKKQSSNPELFARCVEHSMEMGYQGLFPPTSSQGQPSRKAQNVINEERSLATMNKILQDSK